MPIYEFVCESCGRLTEVMQKVSDPPPGACTECGGRVARMVSRTSFQLKGGGWYADLYSSPKEKPAAVKPETPGDAGATPAAPAKADSASPASPASTAAPASPAPAPKAAPAPSAPSGGAAGSGSSGGASST
ncbi:MAG: zinc ribbon domain-containing protein [Anaeromyxobacter sp.]|nr:zinc ribbon domain-containing protein [Anaeromyxobacter sp.]MBL0277809.1 zinc ribbon domain-containing protein [Anaeromyxobacter sp.]